jgi:glycosyltransferase involved in cell wall biosynthesis
MRIALIVPGGVDRSGRERVIPVLLAFVERLARRHHVLVIALDQEPEPSRYPLLGATVVNVGQLRDVGRWQRWRTRLERVMQALHNEGGRYDVLHALWVRGPGSLAVTAGRLLRVPVVVSVGGGELVWLPQIGYGGAATRLGRREAGFVLRWASVVTAPSRYSLAAVARQRPDALWLPWGVDAGTFRDHIRRTPGPPWRLLHVGSLNRVKDHATLLRVLRLLLDRGILVELDCVGEDTLEGSVPRLASELGLLPCIRFHGFRPHSELAPLYRHAHLFIQSSLYESMGAAVLEAAAAGVPTVGTNVGLVSELAPQAAVAVPPGDAPALADAIASLLASPMRREQLGRTAQNFARQFDADWTAASFEGVYKALSRR